MEKIKKGSYLVTDGARACPPCQRHTSWNTRKRITLLENLFAWTDEDQSQLWVCTQVVSIARGRKSKIRFHRAFIHNRKKGKINKDQQSTAGTAWCERLPCNWKSKRRCEGKKWSWPTKGPKTVVKRDLFKWVTMLISDSLLIQKITIFADRPKGLWLSMLKIPSC